MSEWREVSLGEITNKIGSGATPKGGGESYKETGISLIRSQNVLDFKFGIKGLAFIGDTQAYELRSVAVEQNDVLLNITGDSVARCCVVPEAILPARVNQHVAIIRANKQIADNNYIFYSLQALKEELLMQSEIGATRNALTKGMIESLKISIPSLEEQKSIASVLSSLDDKIDLLHRQNTTLERMAETLFRQWFVEEAQEDWEEKRIGDLVKVIDNRGKTPPYTDIPSLCPLIEVNALTGNNRLVDYSVIRKFVDEQTFKTWFRGHPKKYDSLISTVGSIGEISMFLVEKGSIAQNVIALSAVNICPVYLFEALKNIKDEIKELDIGSVQPSIKVPHLLSLKIKIPSKDKIDNFSVIVKSYLEKMIVNYQQILTLEKLRDNLLPKLMSGEVRVGVAG